MLHPLHRLTRNCWRHSDVVGRCWSLSVWYGGMRSIQSVANLCNVESPKLGLLAVPVRMNMSDFIKWASRRAFFLFPAVPSTFRNTPLQLSYPPLLASSPVSWPGKVRGGNPYNCFSCPSVSLSHSRADQSRPQHVCLRPLLRRGYLDQAPESRVR